MEITLHIGPRGCGKSLFVETQLAECKHKLYIGTLERITKHNECIKDHQKRRDHSWLLFEVTKKFHEDCLKLATILEQDKLIEAIMLDGILTWYHFLSTRTKGLSVQEFIHPILSIIKHSKRNWYIVDVPADIFEYEEPEAYYKACKYIQNTLINELEIKSIIDWNYE